MTIAQARRNPSRDIAAQDELTILVLHSPAELEAYVSQIEDLAGDLATSNVFYEPWMLLPLLRIPIKQQRFLFLLITGKTENALFGFFPFERGRIHPWLPFRTLRAPQQQFLLYRTTPLLRAGFEDACFRSLFSWFLRHPEQAQLIDLDRFPGGTSAHRALERQLARERRLRFDALCRFSHLFRKSAHSASFVEELFSSRRVRELRRQRRMLESRGTVQFGDQISEPDIEKFAEEFLALERAGWKGQVGTALASNVHHSEFFRSIVRAGFARGRLLMTSLRVDGRLIAGGVSFASRSGLYSFKIAYDESSVYAQCSPGVLLFLTELEKLYRSGFALSADPHWIDTCASPNSPLMRKVRGEPLPIYHYRIAARGSLVGIFVATLPHLRAAREAVKEIGARARRTLAELRGKLPKFK